MTRSRIKKPLTRLAIVSLTLLLIAINSFGFLLYPRDSAHAITGWKAGNIIDDAVMTRKNSMSISQIQTFLNSRVPTCDTYGKQLSEFGGPDLNGDGKVQRWEWGKKYHNQTKFPCLKDYVQNDKKAARIIYEVSQKYSINPQVLIVLLQKEQSLVTDTWPLNIQYRSATGYGCPDTAPCATEYYGLTNQLDWSAKMFRAILNNSPTWYTPYVLGSNYIQYNPSSSCGGSTVTIENRSTQALYNYTPYQPNKAALDAGWGSAYCGAYGNRNFYLYFTNWFGSTRDKSLQITRSLSTSPTTPTTSDKLTASFIIKNSASYSITIDEVTVAMRDENNAVVNFPHIRDLTIGPGQSYTYSQQRSVDNPGKYRAWIAARLPSGDWSYSWPYSLTSSIVRSTTIDVKQDPNVTLSRSLYFSRTNEYTTEDTSAASFIIKNNEPTAVTIRELNVAARHESGQRLDFPSIKDVTLQPGEEYEYYGRRKLNLAGTYTIWVQGKGASDRWSSIWPESESTTIIRQRDIQINEPPRVSLSQHLRISPMPILAGQRTNTSFTVKNDETVPVTIKELVVHGKNSRGATFDFPSVTNVALDPGEEYTYYQYRTFDDIDTYTFWVSAKVNTDWTDAWPESSSSTIIRKREATSRLPNLTISRSMYLSPRDTKSGQTKAVSFVIKNNESRPVTVKSIGAAVRYYGGTAANFPFVNDLTLNPGESHEYYKSRVYTARGDYKVFIAAYLPSGKWSYTWPYSAQDSIVRYRTFTVK